MSQSSLSQAEIDALFGGGSPPVAEESPEVREDTGSGRGCAMEAAQPVSNGAAGLLPEEIDAMGEIGNIAMGTAATPLSELLFNQVSITNPRTFVACQEEIFRSFDTPYMIIEVAFTKGLEGFNVLVIRDSDVAIIADLMMGGDGRPQNFVLDEISISAASEAMNQMIGTAATAMSDMFNRVIDVTPPKTKLVQDLENADHHPLSTDEPVVVVQFELSVGDLLHTNIMQLTGLRTAKEQVAYLYAKMGMSPPGAAPGAGPAPVVEPGSTAESVPAHSDTAVSAATTSYSEPPAVSPEKNITVAEKKEAIPAGLEVALNLPVEATLVVGRINCKVADVAKLEPGSVINLAGFSGHAELVVNGTVVAVGNFFDGKFTVTGLIKNNL